MFKWNGEGRMEGQPLIGIEAYREVADTHIYLKRSIYSR